MGGEAATGAHGAGRSGLGLVVAASSAGTAFEWYDFFVFVPLAGIIAHVFFAGLNEAAQYVFALGAFAAGFAFRPIGALVFGRIGDRAGRKGTFLITIGLMGAATIAIGFLPTYAQAGVIAPVMFIALRLVQGLALGGEWGGAAIYIAEHTSDDRRGGLTSWIGAAAAFGLGGALLVTLATRTAVGEAAFNAWGWRVPFLASAALLAVSVWIRLQLSESPAFVALKARGERSARPYVESFARWPNLRLVLVALFGVMVAQGAVWYTTFFYAQFFFERVIKVDAPTVNTLMIAAVVASAPLYVLFGRLSDRVGRKPVMLGGMALAMLAMLPAFYLMTAALNPGLAQASRRVPVTVYADPATCSLQFDPVGKAQFRSACDIAKGVLTGAGVGYSNRAAPPGALATVRVGGAQVASADGRGLDAAGLKRVRAQVEARLKAALRGAGYPPHAPAPGAGDVATAFALLMLLVIGATALYGPQAAALVELFPTRIRYTALTLPYHIGTGWVGGFLPATAYAMVAASGNLYFGLWYPIAATTLSIVVTALLFPETRGRSLDF